METYQKLDGTRLKITTVTESFVNINDLKQEKTMLEHELALVQQRLTSINEKIAEFAKIIK